MAKYFDGWKEAVGNRKAHQGLVPTILLAIDHYLPRAPGPRRVTYRLLDYYSKDPVVKAMILKDAGGKTVLDEAVTDTIATMRDIGLLHPNRIHDGRSTVEQPTTFKDADDYFEYLRGMVEDEYRHVRQDGQKQVIEVWTEAADTLPDLRPLADEVGMVLVSCSGSFTVDARSQLGMRIWQRSLKGIVTIILYLGDFDPPGLAIPEKFDGALQWAVRWAEYYRLFWADPRRLDVATSRLAEDEAWTAACAHERALGTGGMAPFLEVERLGVLQADLSGWRDAAGTLHTVTTSPVKERLIKPMPYPNDHKAVIKDPSKRGTIMPGTGAYERFWPVGETETLQLEALDVDEVVRRVRDRAQALTDQVALRRVLAAERAEAADVDRRLASA